MMLEDFRCALPLLIGLGLYMLWATRRQTALNSFYRENQELNRRMSELMQEGIRIQTESNQLMRELADALKQSR